MKTSAKMINYSVNVSTRKRGALGVATHTIRLNVLAPEHFDNETIMNQVWNLWVDKYADKYEPLRMGKLTVEPFDCEDVKL